MKQKLRRSHRSVFGKRKTHPALKAMLWILVCVAVVAAGFFGAKWMTEGPSIQDTSVGDSANSDTPDKGGANDDEHVEPDDSTPPVDTPAITESVRAFYLPSSALSVDTLIETSTLQEAAKAGFNAVIFDLKDADGTLYYEFTDTRAKKTGAYAPNALTTDNLTALFALMQENGLQPIPRLYAFCDDHAAKALADARIGLESNHSWAWYDGDPNNGGKKWLNPYSPAAQDYIGALAEELKAQGAAAILLDGVQFPSQLASAYLGEEAATVSKADALTAFVAAMRTRLGEDCPVMLSCTAKGALATDTKEYGGNPLTFGPAMAAPQLTSKVTESVEAMLLRLQVLEDKPALVPILMMDNATSQETNAAISACVAGGANSFILMSSNYDFDAYTLP